MKTLLYKFNNQPINRKLSAIILLTSGLLISVMIVAVSMEKKFSFRAKLVSNSTVLAEVIGANTTAALVYRDPDTAYEMLSALKAEIDVITAVLYDADGKMFVSYHSGEHPTGSLSDELLFNEKPISNDSSPSFSDSYFDISHNIILDNEVIGCILLRTSLKRLNDQLLFFWLIISGFSLFLLTCAMILCVRLNRTITEPVSQFAETIQNVIALQDYEIRVKKFHNDEIGILVDGFNAMLAQINEREGELEKHRNHLEELVETRTNELQSANKQLLHEIKERQEIQTKLAHAEKMEAIGTLAGGVAHDLNNILSGIVSYPDLLLLELPEDSNMRVPIETIRSSGKKAAAIVQDLLTLARRGAKVEKQFDLQDLVIEYIQSPELNELIKNYPDVKIKFQPKDAKYIMTGSAVQLGKTIMNLVTNGIEAMENGGILQIELSNIFLNRKPHGFEQWRRGNYIRLILTDTGVGIPQKDIKRIFEPFYSRKVMGKSGTGLGMAVVWGTVEDHLGYVTISSKENEGTTIQLLFPAEKNPARQEKKEKTSVEPFRGTQESILVVDDSGEQRQIATDILIHMGYTVNSVDCGEAAVEYLKKHSADLLILDMLMAPGIDGLETYRRILEFRPSQKALIASGYSHPSNIEQARALGIEAYVMKPYSVKHITEVIHRVFNDEPKN